MPSFLNRLSVRLILPAVIAFTALGLLLLYYQSRLISDFIQTDVENRLHEFSRDVFRIPDRVLHRQVSSGEANLPEAIRTVKAEALGEIEEYFKLNAVQGIIYESGDHEVLLTSSGIDNSGALIRAAPPYEAVWEPETFDGVHYAFRTNFGPWNWEILLLLNAEQHGHVKERLSGVYPVAGLAVFLILALMMIYAGRTVAAPVRRIVNDIESGRLPEYKGIHEFQALSDSFAQMAETLRERESKIRDVLQNMPVMLDAFDAEGTIIVWNKECERVTGYTAEEMVGNPDAMKRLYPDDYYREAMLAEMERANYSFRDMESEITRKDGEKRTVSFFNISSEFVIPGWDTWAVGVDVTDRVRAEKAVQESEELYRTLFDYSGDALFVHDFNMRFLSVNKVACDRLGYSRGELLSMSVKDIDTPQAFEQVQENMRLLRTQGFCIFETEHIAKDGRTIPTEIISRLITYGKEPAILSTARDITTRKTAQEALAGQLEINSSLVRAAQLLISSTTLETVSDRILEEAKRLTESRYGFVAYIDPNTGNMVSTTLTRDIWDGCDIPDKSHIFKKFSGLWGWVLKNAEPVMTNAPQSDPRSEGVPKSHIQIERFLAAPAMVGDELVGMAALANAPRDYTETDLDAVQRLVLLYALSIQRMRMEEKLVKSEERMREAQTVAGMGSWEIHHATGEVFWSDEQYRLFGYEPGEVVPNWDMVFQEHVPTDEETFQQDVEKALLTASGPFSLRTRYTRKDGGIRTAHVEGITEHDEAGRPVLSRGVFRDVTEAVLAEQALKKAKHDAEEAGRAKSEFLANMSHEIRTPLNAVINMTELAMTTEPGEEQQEYLQTAKESSIQLLRVIDDILDFSKIEAGKLELDNVAFSLPELLESVLRSMEKTAEAKGLRLYFQGPSPLNSVKGDPVRLRQVLMNLISNAVKFTDQGEVVVEVTDTGRRPEGTALLRFSVTDTGIGIPEQQQHLIFESFRQVDGSFTRRFSGTGLGLSISKQLVELMGGNIALNSKEGEGSEFYFTLPLVPASEDLPEDAQPPPPPDARPRKGLSILLAEDNPVNITVARAFINRLGGELITAKDGAEVLEQLQRQRFEIILMDLEMPVMDGIEAARRIRAGESGINDPEIPIVAMTAHALGGVREMCLAEGMNDYLAKPVAFRDLTAVLARLFPAE